MSMFQVILAGIPALTLGWFLWVRSRPTLRSAPGWLRAGFALGTALLILGYLWIVLNRAGVVARDAPTALQAAVLLWALVFLPLLAVPSLALGLVGQAGASLVRRVRKKTPPAVKVGAAPDRRRFLATSALALPLMATYGATAISIPQIRRFRVREIEVPLAGLPRDLDGVTIAHISDVHVGKFTQGRILDELAETTNRLKADLVTVTGDLIDHSLGDLPEALDMIRRLDPRGGLFLVEGNHDLFESEEGFVDGVRSAGFPLLRNQAAALELRGHPVDVLGLVWSRNERVLDFDVETTVAKKRPDAFPILLAHHPHAFDAAARRGVPLTLGGHTHGGQLMVTPEIGPGPVMYRYWSGLYRSADRKAATVISNGAGNWFPLRTAAPAEILHLTLRRA